MMLEGSLSFNSTDSNIICYHFCEKKFLASLKEKGVIYPKRNLLESTNNRNNAYNYLFDKLQVDSLFFAWLKKSNKDSVIEYADSSSDFVLLTLEVPTSQYILTEYYNWCDVIYCLDENNSIRDAEEIAKSEMKCSFDTVFKSVFDIGSSSPIIQVLLKSIDYSWIKNIEYVSEKII